MILRLLKRLFILCICFIPAALFQGCFTGVEGTSKINLSKKDLEGMSLSEEDKVLLPVKSQSLKDWLQGKKFLVADDRFRMIVNSESDNILKGDSLAYQKTEISIDAGHNERSLITFLGREGSPVVYSIEKPYEEAMESFKSTDLPMLIDLDIVEEAGKILKGQTLWTKSALWYNDSLEYKKGKKFIKVTVTDVLPGNAFFPLLISFQAEGGESGNYLLNVGNSGNESRNFGKLFFSENPKKKYKNISDENWKAIQMEELRLGMTKEESKLSRGNPSEVDAGHSYSNTLEIWYYSNGDCLRFLDGLLVSF